MNINFLKNILQDEPGFRLKQINEAVFRQLIENWNQVLSLPISLIKKLNKDCPLKINAKILEAEDNQSTKAIISLDDDKLNIETVLMKHGNGRNTVCVSSQIGCPMACAFCATGAMGFKRNLTADEIVEQVLLFARYLQKTGKKVSNIVFMGMGEPFLNYDNVISAIKILNDKNGLNIGARKISISTCGIIDGIRKLANEKIQVNLAISLHASDNERRSRIMPINEKYPLEKVLDAVDGYIKKTSRQVMFEYLLLKDFNDSPACAKRLAKLMRKPLYMVNLIIYNQTDKNEIAPSSSSATRRFKEVLEKAGITVTQRYRFGRGIKAACGQLAQ